MEKTSETPLTSVIPDTDKLEENLSKIHDLTTRLVQAMSPEDTQDGAQPELNQALYGQAFGSYMSDMLNNPAKMIEQQVGLWKSAVESWSEGMTKLSETIEAEQSDVATPSSSPKTKAKAKRPDRRFSSPLWQDNPYFSAMSDYYLKAANSLRETTAQMDDLDDDAKRRVDFFTQQYISLMSPSNFLPTNPDAMARAVETNGQSLISGLENLVYDLEHNQGRMGVSLSDRTAFQLGENIATSPGDIVFENELFQLIQFSPGTKEIYETPLLIFPPWINKYYILDLQPENSFIKYAVDSGLTVFVVSWVNPLETTPNFSFEDYMTKGSLVAIETVQKITGQEQINTIGYCIGGTLMSCTLAWLAQKDQYPVHCNTFFTTLTDFEDPGELGVFIEDGMIDTISELASETGVLDSYYMGQVFSYLRPDNLVYGPAVRAYMMGEKPRAFDLLYWNDDSPNMPGKMIVEYLTSLYLNNELIKGEFEFGGLTLNLDDVKTPFYAIATQTDHIAPWQSSFNGLRKFGSDDTRFILAGSGHIAGVINPADSVKYGYKTNPNRPGEDLQAWEADAASHKGSWWNDWQDWISERSGAKIKARKAGSSEMPIIESAPGRYVKQ